MIGIWCDDIETGVIQVYFRFRFLMSKVATFSFIIQIILFCLKLYKVLNHYSHYLNFLGRYCFSHQGVLNSIFACEFVGVSIGDTKLLALSPASDMSDTYVPQILSLTPNKKHISHI